MLFVAVVVVGAVLVAGMVMCMLVVSVAMGLSMGGRASVGI